ncbi:hypothetical protein FoTM2_013428 [Fusarium oxysporum f. sp. vasinfectum]|nr:hypothetical protein FoTM2_013428 [Fusarium oxysporum f. sp. vasinfectum]
MKVSSLTVAYELGTVNDAASSSSTAPMSNQAHCYSNPEPDSSNASAAAIRQPAWNRASPNLRRMMLLNGYPLGYLILWTPGVVNRFIEIKGKSPPWLVALLASTQYIGLQEEGETSEGALGQNRARKQAAPKPAGGMVEAVQSLKQLLEQDLNKKIEAMKAEFQLEFTKLSDRMAEEVARATAQMAQELSQVRDQLTQTQPG